MSDQNLKDLFSDRLSGHESPVDPSIWTRIEAALPAAPGAGVVVAKTVISKVWLVAAASVVITAVVAVLVLQNGKEAATPSGTPETKTTTVQADVQQPIQTPEAVDQSNSGLQEKVAAQPPHQVANSGQLAEEEAPVSHDDDRTTKPEVASGSAVTPSNSTTEQPENQNSQSSSSTSTCKAGFAVIRVKSDLLRYFFIPECTEASEYLWIFPGGENSHEMSPTFTFEEQGTFVIELRLTDVSGNNSSVSHEVRAYLPATFNEGGRTIIFTPNADGMNDVFDPADYAVNFIPDRLFVYDRSNALVYESEGSGGTWTGDNKAGEPCTDGTYRVVVSGKDLEGSRIGEKASLLTLRRN